MNKLVNAIVVFISFAAFGQYKCKEKLGNELQTIKQCFHISGQLSSEEIWNSDKRFGTFTCYDVAGKILKTYHLRTIGGHASAHVTYHKNGQVATIEYSSAPDGGIQFYDETIKFDEKGIVIYFIENEYPPKLTVYHELMKEEPIHDSVPQYVVPVTPKKEKTPEVISCAIPYITMIQIENKTNKKLNVVLPKKQNKFMVLEEKNMFIGKKQIVQEKVIQAQYFLDEIDFYIPELVNDKRTYSLIQGKTIQNAESRIFMWYIVKN